MMSAGKDESFLSAFIIRPEVQMAEALLKQIAGDRFEVESAGLEPGRLNPLAVEVMKEIGIDISENQTKSAFDLFKDGRLYTQ